MSQIYNTRPCEEDKKVRLSAARYNIKGGLINIEEIGDESHGSVHVAASSLAGMVRETAAIPAITRSFGAA